MAVKIRLARGGAKRRPVYRVVVTDARSPRDGRFIEQIGMFDPTRQPEVFTVKSDRFEHWLSVGAQASDTLRNLVKKQKKEQTSAA